MTASWATPGITVGGSASTWIGAEGTAAPGAIVASISEECASWGSAVLMNCHQAMIASPAGVIATCGRVADSASSIGVLKPAPAARVATCAMCPGPVVLCRSQALTVSPAASIATTGLLASRPGAERFAGASQAGAAAAGVARTATTSGAKAQSTSVLFSVLPDISP